MVWRLALIVFGFVKYFDEICLGIKENLSENTFISKNFNINFECQTLSTAHKDICLGDIEIEKLVWAVDLEHNKKYDIIILSDWYISFIN